MRTDDSMQTPRPTSVADFMSTEATSPRQAFFAQFANKARECLKTDIPAGIDVPLILLTGGLRSPAHLQSVLDAGHADLLGVGRGSLLRPDIPAILQQRILNSVISGTSITLDDRPFAHEPGGDVQLPSWLPQIPLVGAGVNLAWYSVHIRRIAASQLEKRVDGAMLPAPLPAFGMTGIEAIVRMWFWLEWHEMFIGAFSVCCMGVLVYHVTNGIYVGYIIPTSSV